MSPSRILRWACHAVWSISMGLVACFALLLLSIGQIDWSFLKSTFEDAASKHLHGRLVLEGELTFELLPVARFEVAGFRIEDIGTTEPKGALSAGRTEGSIALLPLLDGVVDIARIEIADLMLDVALSPAKSDETPPAATPAQRSVSALVLRKIEIGVTQAVIRDTAIGETHTIRDGRITVALGLSGVSEDAMIASLTGAATVEAASFTSRGAGDLDIAGLSATFERLKPDAAIDSNVTTTLAVGAITAPTDLIFEGTIARPFDLLRGRAMQIKGTGRLGDLALDMDGQLTSSNGTTSAEFEMTAKAEGDRFLSGLAGHALPITGSTAAGTFIYRRSHYELADFNGIIAGVSAKGGLVLTLGQARPHLGGRLSLGEIALAGGEGPSTPGKMIPPLPIRMDALSTADVDVQLAVERVNLTSEALLEDITADINLDMGVLTLDPARLRMDKGEMTARVVIASNTAPQKFSLNATMKGMQIERFVRGEAAIVAGDARADMTVDVSGAGDDLQSLAATLTGTLETDVTGGQFKLGALARMVAGSHGIFDPLLRGGDLSSLHCAMFRWRLDNGLATSQGLVLDTTDFAVAGRGVVDLRSEELTMDMAIHPARIQLLNHATAFQVGGTLDAPTAKTESLGAIAGIINVAGATVNPLGAIVLVQKEAEADPGACRRALDTSGTITEQPMGLTDVITGPLGVAGEVVKGAGSVVGGALKKIGEGVGSIFGGGSEPEE